MYAPRDFDISPYFSVVKPTIEQGFDYKALLWIDRPLPPKGRGGYPDEPVLEPGVTLVPEAERDEALLRTA